MTPMDHSQPQLPCPWNFLGKNTGVGCHSLLQGIFPTRGLSLSLPHCGQTLYRLSYQGSAVNARQHRGARPRLHADSQRRILAPSHLISGGAIGGGGRGENLLSRHPVGGEHQYPRQEGLGKGPQLAVGAGGLWEAQTQASPAWDPPSQ